MYPNGHTCISFCIEMSMVSGMGKCGVRNSENRKRARLGLRTQRVTAQRE